LPIASCWPAGKDPAEVRDEKKADAVNTLRTVAAAHFKHRAGDVSATTIARDLSRLKTYIFPKLGDVAIRTITPTQVLTLLRTVEGRGVIETAHRVLEVLGRIFRWAVGEGLVESDITRDLRGLLKPAPESHYATLVEPRAIGALLRAVDSYRGDFPVIEFAMKILSHTFVRSSELRFAEWREFDLDAAEWRIPAPRMKGKVMHVVPLSRQCIALLRDLQNITGNGRLLFPSIIAAKARLTVELFSSGRASCRWRLDRRGM